PLYKGDVIRTGKPGAAGIVLTDDTTISMGSGSEISMNDYVFQPKDGKFSLAIKMVKGTFAYVTGQIVKLSPESAQVQTPDATIAVRGTKILVQISE
ncbi:MAG: FecR family protein, partial [Burkholderiaceae bacterium]|nr:FecR family protein [Burkholderiaceae bacterium]